MSIIDLNEELKKRNGADSEHVYVDADGVKWFKYLCDYEHNKKKLSFFIWATSLDDADDKLYAIIDSGEIVGQVLHEQNQ